MLDITVCAARSDLRDPSNLSIGCTPDAYVDAVTATDITYNKVMSYAVTPLNGRIHSHHFQCGVVVCGDDICHTRYDPAGGHIASPVISRTVT